MSRRLNAPVRWWQALALAPVLVLLDYLDVFERLLP